VFSTTMRAHERLYIAVLGAVGMGALSSGVLAQCISLNAVNSPYYQDFNTLVSSGTSSATPPGWTFFESGANADGVYTAGDGSSSAGDTYSFGYADSDRAFGVLHGGSVVPRIGACFVNNTGSGIQQLQIFYVGEQWRRGNGNIRGEIAFEYSLSATDLQTGIWTGVSGLSFVAPNHDPMPSALDGNAAANRTALTTTLNDLSIPDGSTFWIRWTDPNAQSGGDGLGVDDFVLTVGTATSVQLSSLASTIAAFPNPSSSSFSIRYRLFGGGPAELAVFDLSGRRVTVLASGIIGNGQGTLEWDAHDETGRPLAPGPYFVRLTEGERVEKVRVAIVR
jgi:hypothetical protein